MDYSYKNKTSIFSPERPLLGCSLIVILLIILFVSAVQAFILFCDYKPKQRECTVYIPDLQVHVKYERFFGDSIWKRIEYCYPNNPPISRISFSRDSIFGTDYITFKQHEYCTDFYIWENGLILVTKPEDIVNFKSTHFDIVRMLSWREYPANFDFVKHHKLKLKYQENMDVDSPFSKRLFDSTFMNGPSFLIDVKYYGRGFMVYDASRNKIADKDVD